jgi:hypothetical protein
MTSHYDDRPLRYDDTYTGPRWVYVFLKCPARLDSLFGPPAPGFQARNGSVCASTHVGRNRCLSTHPAMRDRFGHVLSTRED